MKLIVILMMVQRSSLKHNKLTPVVYLKICSRVFGFQHVVLVWKIIAMLHKRKASKIYKLSW